MQEKLQAGTTQWGRRPLRLRWARGIHPPKDSTVTPINIFAAPLLAGGLIAAATPIHSAVSLDVALRGFLSDSTEALVLGPTFTPTPDSSFLSAVDTLYLQPLGFDGTTVALTTPETLDFGPSIAQGETDLVNAVLAAYQAGDIGPTDPLTIFAYSQSAVVASLAEQTLFADGVPTTDLDFVFIGDPSSAEGGYLSTTGDTAAGEQILTDLGASNLIGATTPDNDYPTDVYTLQGDGFANWANLPELEAIGGMFSTHLEYLGLTEAEIQAATETVDGLTNYFTIADPTNPLQALLEALMAFGM